MNSIRKASKGNWIKTMKKNVSFSARMCYLINLFWRRHLSVNISLSLSASCFLFSFLLICSGLIWTLLSLLPFSPSLPLPSSPPIIPSHPASSSLLLPLVCFIHPPPFFSPLHHPLYLTSSSPPFFPRLLFLPCVLTPAQPLLYFLPPSSHLPAISSSFSSSNMRVDFR